MIGAVYKAVLFEEQTGTEPDIKRVMDSQKVTDHHAIIPTIEIAKADLAAMPEGEMKIPSPMPQTVYSAPQGKSMSMKQLRQNFAVMKLYLRFLESLPQNGWKDFEAAFRRSYKTVNR